MTNQAPQRVPLPPFEGKLRVWLVRAPEDGPEMYRETPRMTHGEGTVLEPADTPPAVLDEHYPGLTCDADAEAPDHRHSR
jgi:hypothetical protein